MLPQAVSEHYTAQQRLIVATLGLTRAEWSRMGADFDASWARLGPRILLLTASAQLGAARSGAAYVPDALAELGTEVDPVGEVVPGAFSGVASDGRSLDALLGESVIRAKVARDNGATASDALTAAGKALDMYVHTQVADAARGAASVAIAARPTVGWVRMVNPPCCGRCAVLAGKWFRYNQGFQRHPRCFPAGVAVSGPETEAAARRWYEGELVVLSTSGGQNLPLTGNHPVLTSRGWVPANMLREGDEVVRSTRPQGANALVVPDHDQMPALIEDVWRSLSMCGFERVPSSPEDFHGDGQHGEVDVVDAHRALRDGGHSSLRQQSVQRGLAVGGMPAVQFDGQGASVLLDLRHAAQTGGAVGGSGLRFALVGSHLGGANRPGLTGSPALDAEFGEALGYGSAGDAVLARQGVLAGTFGIGGDDIGRGQREPLARWDAPGLPLSVKTSEGYASHGRDLLDRLAGQVELDRVVEVRRVKWSGHVYSLTSVEGWHVANSFIVSNCDCRHIPAPEDAAGAVGTSPRALFDGGHVKGLTSGQAKAIREGADPARVINASRKASGMTTTEAAAKGRRRLTPDGIYHMAPTREGALELLREHGYLT